MSGTAELNPLARAQAAVYAMTDEATLAQLQAQLADCEASRKKMEQQAKNYVAKLNAEKAAVVKELEESKALLAQAAAQPAAGSGDGGEASTRIAALEEETRQLKDQAKAYVKTLVSKHNAEMEKLKAEHDEALKQASVQSGRGGGDCGDSSSAGAETVTLQEQLAEAQGQLAEAKEQAKAYVKQLVTRHKADIDEMRVKQTELQEEVDNLRANAEAHNLEMNAKDNSLHEVRERLNAALQVRALAHELARPHACMGIRK